MLLYYLCLYWLFIIIIANSYNTTSRLILLRQLYCNYGAVVKPNVQCIQYRGFLLKAFMYKGQYSGHLDIKAAMQGI